MNPVCFRRTVVMVLLIGLADARGAARLVACSRMVMLKPVLRQAPLDAGLAGGANCFPRIRGSSQCCV